MTRRDDTVSLQHILEAATKVRDFTRGRVREDLDSNEMLALAITRLIEIIGEASRQISEHLKMQHPGIPWREMAGARNRIIHRYFEVDLDIVWQITQHDVPALVPHVQAVLASLS